MRSKSIVFLLAWILRSDHLSECQHLYLHHQSTVDLLHLHYLALETPYFNHRSTVSWLHLYHKDCHPVFIQLSIWIIAFYATIHLHLHPSILVLLACSFSILFIYFWLRKVGWLGLSNSNSNSKWSINLLAYGWWLLWDNKDTLRFLIRLG